MMKENKQIKLGINARTLAAGKLRGWSRYTINLLQELQHLGFYLYLFSDKPFEEKFLSRLSKENYETIVEPHQRYFLWEQRVLPKLCKKYDVDLLFCPINYGLPYFTSCPQALTLHDAITEKYYFPRETLINKLKPGALLWRVSNKISHARADKVITVSQHARGDLISFLKIPEEKIEVVYEAADPVFDQKQSENDVEKVRLKHGIREKYFFYIGGWEERKNISFLLKSFSELKGLDVQLVLGGGSAKQKAMVSSEYSFLGDRLKLLEWVEDEELPALYQGARAFIYPSEYEGFGLQVCEAMKMGCPVLVSNQTSLPEIVGRGGDTFSLSSYKDIQSQMEKVVNDEGYYIDMKKRAEKRSLEFTWKKAAEETAIVFRNLVDRADS